MIPEDKFDLLVLSESFSSPYGINYFKEYAENLDSGGPTINFLRDIVSKITINKEVIWR